METRFLLSVIFAASLPHSSIAMSPQQRAQTALSSSDEIKRDMGTPEEREWTDISVSNCTVTFSHFHLNLDGERRLDWSDRVPVSAFEFRHGERNHRLIAQVLSPVGKQEPPNPIFYVSYQLPEGVSLQRTFPELRLKRRSPVNRPKPPSEKGPVLDGEQYMIGKRDKGGFLATQPSDLSFYKDWIEDLRSYALEFCVFSS